MAKIASVPPWNPEDDLLLKNALEGGASLEALAKGAVRFSRKFTLGELRERWRSLLYDDGVAAEASARMVEFELSNPNLLSKFNRFSISRATVGVIPAKRKGESIRRQYYERRKKLCTFNTFDSSLIDDPNVKYVRDEADCRGNLTVSNEPLDGNYMVDDHVQNYYEFPERGPSGLDHVSSSMRNNVLANDCPLVDNLQQGHCSLAGGFLEDSYELNTKHDNADEQVHASRDTLVDFRNCQVVGEVGTSNSQQDMPLWKSIEDVLAPEMLLDIGLEVKHNDAEETLLNLDDMDDKNINSLGDDDSQIMLEVRVLDNEINRSTGISGGGFVDISDCLLNLTTENEPLVMGVDGEDMMNDSGNMPSNSPKVVHNDDVPKVCQPQTLESRTCHAVSEDVVNAEKEASALFPSAGVDQDIICSELNISSTKSLQTPCSSEFRYEMMECTLNTEDPEIPCNDDLVQPGFTEASDPATSSTNPRSSTLESISLTREENPAGPFMASQTVGYIPKTNPKSEPSNCNRLASISKQADNVLAGSSQCRSAHPTPKFAAHQVLNEEGKAVPVTTRELALLSTEAGATDLAFMEPETDPTTLDNDESEEELDGEDDDVPYFSDIENMILEMDLSPDFQDSYLSKEVSRYQHEDMKMKIVRLEQCAKSSMNRNIASRGAFAVFYGRRLKQYIKKTEVILGRTTENYEVDIDLGKERNTNSISRRQALLKMEGDGSFSLQNLGKNPIFVNGKEVGYRELSGLSPSSLIEIRGLSFVFEINHKYVRRYLDKNGRSSIERHSKFEWSAEMAPDSGPPAHWSDAATLEYLELLAAYSTHSAGIKIPTPTVTQWAHTLYSHHGYQYRVKQLRTRYQRFRKVYHLFMGMKNDTGLGWDETLQTVTCPPWKWADYCKQDKELKQLEKGLPHFDLYHAIFGGASATGREAAPSTDPYMHHCNIADEGDSIGDEDGDEPTTDTGPRSGDKRPSSSRGGNGKKKRGSRVAEYESNMSALASVLRSKFDTDVSSAQSRQSGPQGGDLEEVTRIVGNLPDLTEQQVIHAFEFFRVNPDAQRMFLTMQERYRSGYIRSVVP